MCKCWMQWLPIAVIFMFFVLTLLLTACGIKGPIYLPNEDTDKQQKGSAPEKKLTATAAPTITANPNNKD